MSFHTIVMTSGISAINHDKNIFLLSNDENAFIKNNDLSLNTPVSETDLDFTVIEETVDTIVQKLNKRLRALDADIHHKISAEYSLFYRLKQENSLHAHPRIIMLTTRTVGGEIASKVLMGTFQRFGVEQVDIRYIENWNIEDRQQMRFGIADFFKKLGNALQSGEPQTTAFSPVGGYKVMTAYGYLVGSYLGYPSLYLHEDGQTLLTIPPMPIKIDQQLFQKNKAFLRKLYIEKGVALSELKEEERNFIETHSVFFEYETFSSDRADEHMVGLSPFTEYILEQEGIVRLDVLLSRQVKDMLARDQGLQRDFCSDVQSLVDKLRIGQQNDLTNHEQSFKQLDHAKMNYALCKCRSGKGNLIRLAYRYDKTQHRLFARYLWTDHKLYDREVPEGVGLYGGGMEEEKNYTSFESLFGRPCV